MVSEGHHSGGLELKPHHRSSSYKPGPTAVLPFSITVTIMASYLPVLAAAVPSVTLTTVAFTAAFCSALSVALLSSA